MTLATTLTPARYISSVAGFPVLVSPGFPHQSCRPTASWRSQPHRQCHFSSILRRLLLLVLLGLGFRQGRRWMTIPSSDRLLKRASPAPFGEIPNLQSSGNVAWDKMSLPRNSRLVRSPSIHILAASPSSVAGRSLVKSFIEPSGNVSAT